MSVSTLENTVCKRSLERDPAAASCEHLIRGQIPNLFRLWQNPYVAQACYCLDQLVGVIWPGAAARQRVFLANSGDEALSGAIKLARYSAHREGRSGHGVLIDEFGQFEHFAATEFSDGKRIEYIPGLSVHSRLEQGLADADSQSPPGFLVIESRTLTPDAAAAVRRSLEQRQTAVRPVLIVYQSDENIPAEDAVQAGRPDVCPEIVVFDESWTRREVPFGAFVAARRLFRHWNRCGMATFHSTTFQPNSVSSLHLLRCLQDSQPAFMRQHADILDWIQCDAGFRESVFRELYSRSLSRLIRVSGVGGAEARTDGHYIRVNGRRIFDAVAGVACSLRGHNPPEFCEELQETGSAQECRDELSARLHRLTGLPHVSPAVSGASAVEQALKIGLASQFPRQHVLALRGGFGGKTLFALTGTSRPSLKAGLDPLYPHVTYIDPSSPDACEQIASAFRRYPVGVVQLELVQAVGGIRAVPGVVLDCLRFFLHGYDCLLFVDEVQTGMHRTGPFIRSQAVGLKPDVLTIGKGTSDMMIPCAVTLHSDDVERRLRRKQCGLVDSLRTRADFDLASRTIVNTLRWAESRDLEAVVAARGQTFAHRLREDLSDCPNVREVRGFGLLVGIELEQQGWLQRSMRPLALLAMLQHAKFPLLVGYCQYEPHVLKLTPPLTVTDEELRDCAATIAEVLNSSPARMVGRGIRRLTVRPLLDRLNRRSATRTRP